MKKLSVAAAAICFVFSLTIHAQTSAPASPSSQQPEISPEKMALLKELNEATGVKKQAGDVLAVIMGELEKQTVEDTWALLSAMPEMKVLTEAEREDLKQQLSDSSARQMKSVIDGMNHKIDYGQLIEDVQVVVYAKYFNEKELKDLLAFYKSDTGQRSMQLMPSLLADVMSETGRRLTPVMNDVMRDIAANDTSKFRNQVTAMAKAHHRQSPAKRKPIR